MNVVAVRINLLARNVDPTLGYTDSKTYTLGLKANDTPLTFTPNDNYKRHAYTSVVKLVDVSQRRETP
jgi:type IV pilus assembly protein PilW